MKPQRYALVGMRHRGGEAFVAAMKPDTPLILVRDPGNRWDANAVEVWAMDGSKLRHVGFISKDQNAVLARFIDQHAQPCALGGPVLPLDAPMAADSAVEVKHGVKAQLHMGNNKWPLIEVV